MARILEDIKNEWIDHVGEKAEKFGFPRIAGQLEGLLYLSREAMSLDDMAARLEVSKASVSTNIRYLERWKVVRRIYHRGERKNFYEIAGDIWEIETEIVSTLVRDELDRFNKLIARGEVDLKGIEGKSSEEKKDITQIKARFAEIKEYLEAGDYFLGLLMQKGKITSAIVKKIQIV